MRCQVQVTALAKSQVAGLRGKARAAYDTFTADLGNRGCAALGYRLSGEAVEKLCIRHLRGNDRAVVAFPAPDVATIVLVAPHTSDPDTSVYDLLYRMAGVETPPHDKRTKPACCDPAGDPPVADEYLVDDLVQHTRRISQRR